LAASRVIGATHEIQENREAEVDSASR